MAETDFNKLIAITSTGLTIANYNEVRNLLVEKFQDIYGKDIDVSLDSADGIYINNIALLIYNLLRFDESLYNNANPDTATGKALDIICSFNNVKRKSASKSTAYVTLTNKSKADITINKWNGGKVDQLALIDKAGNIWYLNDKYSDVVIEKGASWSGWCTYSDTGAYSAPIGWINGTVELNGRLAVNQSKIGITGEEIESDDNLRSRRLAQTGSLGRSNLQSLKAALMQLDGIEDVAIINNSNNYTIGQYSSEYDGYNVNAKPYDTTIGDHMVSIAIRPKRGADLNRDDIADTIWNKMVPGVMTQSETCLEEKDAEFARKYYTKTYYCSRKNGNAYETSDSESDFDTNVEDFKSGDDEMNLIGVIKGKNMSSVIQNQYVFWKELKALHPTLIITYDATNKYNVGSLPSADKLDDNISISDDITTYTVNSETDTSSTTYAVAANVIEYVNELGIYEDIDAVNIRDCILTTDPQTSGQRTMENIYINAGSDEKDDGMTWDDEQISFIYNTENPTHGALADKIKTTRATRNLGSYFYYNDWRATISVNNNTGKMKVSMEIFYNKSLESN